MLVCVILILGFTGMAAQTFLLRELLTVFSGNELVIGGLFGLWMIGEAAGALLAGRFCTRRERVVLSYVSATLVFVVLFPASVGIARLGKLLLGIPPEVSIGAGSLFLISASVILPVALAHGFQFIASTALAREQFHPSVDAVGRVYSLETLGTVAGGVAMSLLFFPYVDSFQAAALLAFCNTTACYFLLAGAGFRQVALSGCLAGVMVFALLAPWTGVTDFFQRQTVRLQWGGKQPLVYRNSPYQNIVVMEAEGQYTLFTDGKPQLAVPVPDIAFVEEFVHLPMLCHPEPRDILVLGGGVGGVIAELLKHPSVRRVEYVEPDPAILATVRSLSLAGTSRELSDPRVSTVHADAREFLSRAARRYDLILLNFPLPETLQANRFFTAQFYAGLNRLLTERGVAALPVTGSSSYYSAELAGLNLSVRATLGRSFPAVALIPGEPNLFVAGSAKGVEGLDPNTLTRRLKERRIAARLMSGEQIAYRLSPENRDWLDRQLHGFPGSVNRDYDPRLLYLNLIYRARMHASHLSDILLPGERLTFPILAAAIAMIGVATVPFIRRTPAGAVAVVVAGTGVSAMFGELLLLYAFQIYYGSLFHSVGLLLALFMAGIAVGSHLAGAGRFRLFSDAAVMVSLECALVLLFLLLGGYFALVDRMGASFVVLPAIVGGMLLTGTVTGMTYPIASRLFLSCRGATAVPGAVSVQGAGVIYAADLAGGCLGGVVGAVLLLPGVGIIGSCIALAMIKAVTCLLLLLSRIKSR